MRGRIFAVMFILGVITCFGQGDWKKEGIKLPRPICYASNESHQSFIGPPREYFEHLKSASNQKATIEVTYVGFPPEAQKAFQYAVDIWKNLIYSPVPIRVQATWQSLSAGVLGSCGPSQYYHNFNSTQKWNCYYPVALVEKMLGEEVNGADQFDIIGSFNKDFTNWYFGTNGKTPVDKYDFVSTVLHEMTHGLGFSGFFYSDKGRGAYDYENNALSAFFDQNVKDRAGSYLVNTALFPNPSIILNQEFTSGWLDYNTRLAGNPLPRLFAPSTWDSGSSIYHLDDLSYPAGSQNSLMTPFTGKGEAIFDPGPLTLAIMYDLGWKNISIKHKPLKDIEFISAPVEFNAQILSDYNLDSTKVFLVYSNSRFVKGADSIPLKATDIPTNFLARISSFQGAELSYFFSATDKMKRRYVFPSNAPARYFSFKIGIDKEAPVVTHTPIKYMTSTNLTAKIKSIATDNLGIKSVKIQYFINKGNVQEITMVNDSIDQYTGNLVFPAGSVAGGDRISYRIVAEDASSQGNIGRSPLSGYNTFVIEGIQSPVEKYVNNFNTPNNDFISSDFSITTPAGFDSPSLNSAHPYLSPDADNKHFNFTAILRYPIILKMGGKMSYDEIVLVEPGDPGSKFGDVNFWDYVIVEGSKDGGINWKPLLDGYDSNAQKTWYNLWISSPSGQNSTAVPTKDLFVKREFGLLANGNFTAGDTIQVRFRLYSDPYSHGWGWVVDNLSIQDVGTGANSLAISSGEVLFYPNPASEKINVQFQAKNRIDKVNLKAYNSSGELVYVQQFSVGSNSFQAQINVQNFRAGLYLFALEPENGQVITRKILIR